MKRPDSFRLLSLATFAALAACSGSGGSTTSETKTGGEFLALKTDPTSGSTIYLNEPIHVDFSTAVDLDSASLQTVTFQALDQTGSPVSELVSGQFRLETSPGDTEVGRRLQFVPRYATNNAYDNGGLRAGRRYLVQLIGGTANNNTVLRSKDGKALDQPLTFTFNTREGTQPGQIYRNPLIGGPRRVDLQVSTATSLNDVPLGLFGAPPVEVRLLFDQALNPNDANLPVNLDTNPLVIDEGQRGRVFLEYRDPTDVGALDFTWIPADVEIERNDNTGSTLVLRPIGVLPNNAEVRVIVENTLEDIAGESNAAALNYNRVFGTFRTSASYEQQWNAVIDEFQELGNIDLGAAFPESQAEIGLGYVRAGFAFGGNPTSLDYRPTANEVVLNTGFTQIVPANGLPFTVSDGVFNFRNVEIPQGVTVVGQGPNPMVWLCSGDFKVSGTLTVRGGNGARVDTLNSANFAKAGGIGVCGGGNGGDGTPSPNTRDLRGGTGRGPLQEAGKGGRGGYLACISGCYTGTGYNSSGGGSGGGGGTLATQGDPNWGGTTPATINPNTPPTANTSFQQLRGFGGTGCSGGSGTRSGFLNGGEPGDLVFTDSRTSNNFWGSGIDVFQNLRITGELAQPVGGGGGGGGGDTSNNFNCSLTGGDPVSDYSGGGGGGGGGVLIVKCLGNIDILASGNINANGGNGGGGEQVGSCGEAGGGGGGAGGMVILMSAQNIRIEAHGSTVTNRFAYQANAGAPFGGLDYSFAVSADGGVCLTGGFGSVNISNKYPAAGATMLTGAIDDGDPLGGLGGMGIVQLMVPPGIGTSTDGTNTRLDDNIRFFRPGTLGTANEVEYLGAQKEQLLAWRGFPNAQGIPVSDAGTPISLGKNEGDIRPSPTLLPVPFNPQSRVRSNWIDTGSSGRRDLAAADGLPRGVVTAGGAAIAGPRYEFGGTNTTNGFVSYTPVGSTSVNINYPQVGSALPLARVEAGASYLGQPAYRITLASAGLPSGSRYAQYEAELRNDVGSTIASYRILQHTEQELLVAVGEDLLPTDATQVAIRAKFFKIITDGSEGLGRAALFAGQAMPLANVRIGFAFHVDPNPANLLNGRFPNTSLQAFQYDLEDPALLSWLATNQPRYVMWDVLFDMSFKPGEQLSSSTPRPELHYLRLPFRF